MDRRNQRTWLWQQPSRSTFQQLPRSPQQISLRRQRTKTFKAAKETILLVEDEPVVRELVREILQTYNYSIIEAGSGVEALRVWDQHDGKIDLLLTDIHHA